MQAEFPVVIVIGTRSEGIKMAPVYLALKRAGIPTKLICVMSHDILLREVLELFGITPDYDLQIALPSQDLFYVTQTVLQKTKEIYEAVNPLLVLIQGDTTISMAAGLSAFYLRIPVGHVEAGLHIDDVHNPFPEEMNRKVIGVVSNFHFAPTPAAVANILAHGMRRDAVFCTGNTVIDALHIVKEKVFTAQCGVSNELKAQVKYAQEREMFIGMLAFYRRESFDAGIERVLQTVKHAALMHKEILWIYPYNPNPHVVEAIQKVALYDAPTIYLTEPLRYSDMVFALDAVDFVLTDSGGVQEEAISLGKPVLVLREKTERMEGVLAGRARVVGTQAEKILAGIEWALSESLKKNSHHTHDLYGDGHAAEKIVAFIQSRYEALQEGALVRCVKVDYMNRTGEREQVI